MFKIPLDMLKDIVSVLRMDNKNLQERMANYLEDEFIETAEHGAQRPDVMLEQIKEKVNGKDQTV